MGTPPTLVAANIVANNVNGVRTSASLTLQANDVIVWFGVGEGGSTGDAVTTPTCTFSNSGIVTLQTHTAAGNCPASVYTTTVTANGSGTCGVTYNVTLGTNCALTVLAYRNAVAPIVARSAQGSSSSRTLSYTPSQVDSAIAWVVGDWSASAAQVLSPTSTSHTSASPGPTAFPGATQTGTAYTHYEAVLDDQTSAGAVSYGIGGSGTGPFTIFIVEIQGPSGPPPVPDEGSFNSDATSDMWGFSGMPLSDGSF
jgi:hypothetical protein